MDRLQKLTITNNEELAEIQKKHILKQEQTTSVYKTSIKSVSLRINNISADWYYRERKNNKDHNNKITSSYDINFNTLEIYFSIIKKNNDRKHGNWLFSDLFLAWFAFKIKTWTVFSIQRNTTSLKNIIKPVLFNYKLKEINSEELKKAFKLINNMAAKRNQRRIRGFIFSCFEFFQALMPEVNFPNRHNFRISNDTEQEFSMSYFKQSIKNAPRWFRFLMLQACESGVNPYETIRNPNFILHGHTVEQKQTLLLLQAQNTQNAPTLRGVTSQPITRAALTCAYSRLKKKNPQIPENIRVLLSANFCNK